MNSDLRSAFKAVYSPFLDRAGLCGAETILTQMSDDLRTMSASAGCITEADLELLGWTKVQLAKYGQDACRLARAKSAAQRIDPPQRGRRRAA